MHLKRRTNGKRCSIRPSVYQADGGGVGRTSFISKMKGVPNRRERKMKVKKVVVISKRIRRQRRRRREKKNNIHICIKEALTRKSKQLTQKRLQS